MNPAPQRILFFLTLNLLVAGCSSGPDPELLLGPGSKTRYALVIGVDGARPDALLRANTPSMDALIQNGRWTPAASTQLAAMTSSGPGWMSILTGVSPDKHGVVANGLYIFRDPDYKTFLWRARHEGGVSTMLTVTWPELFEYIIEEDAYDEGALDTDEGSTLRLETTLVDQDHRLLFVHLDEPDHAGHSSGFSADNPDYLNAIETIDAQIGRLMSAIEKRPTRAEEEWLIAMTTDHGGDAAGHGSLSEGCRTIWLLLSGDGIKTGDIPPDDTHPVSHMDVFPSIMEYLGIEIEERWELEGTSRLEFTD